MTPTHDRSSQLIDLLIERYEIKSKRELGIKLGYPPKGSHINEVYGKRALFNELAIEKLKDLKANYNWVLTGEGEPFTDGYKTGSTFKNEPIKEKIIPVVIDGGGKEYITFIPLAAQAGFFTEYPENPSYLDRFTHFNIPGYHNGTALAFPVEGDSMLPTLNPNDIIIAEPVRKLEWIDPKEIHVVVCERGRLIKRWIYHNHTEEPFLEWIADNEFYNDLPLSQRSIPASEVKSVFKRIFQISSVANAPDKTYSLIKEILAKLDAIARRDINI